MAKRPPKQTYYERSEAYAKQVSGEIIEQIKKGTAPWQKALEAGGTNRSVEYSRPGKPTPEGTACIS